MKRVFILLLVAMTLVGCGGLRNLMVDPEKDREKIGKQVGMFHRARYWGDSDLAATFVVPEKREEFGPVVAERVKSEKLVKYKIRSITVDPEQETAEVRVEVEFYKIPNYVVQTRLETQKWELRNLSNWYFVEADEKLL